VNDLSSPEWWRPEPGDSGASEWLKEHGILPDVWKERYVRYSRGSAVQNSEGDWVGSTEGVQRILDEYAGLDFKQQVRFALNIANGGKDPYRQDNFSKYPGEHPQRVDAGGFLIMRHAPPRLEHYGKVYAEMRPDNSVATRYRTWHYHGPRPYPEHVKIDKKTGRPCKPKEAGWQTPIAASRIYAPEQMRDHIGRELYDDDHFPGDPRLNEVHCHQRVAKYCFIPGLRVDIAVVNEDGTPRMDENGEPITRSMKDEESIARRLDMHRMAAERLEAGVSLVYFCAEGCLKADAILSEILRYDLDASVVSVPSVTLWNCEELEDFIRMYLQGKRVVIVCDADGARNDRVWTQMLLLRSFLWNRGVADTEVVAPPYPGSKQKPAPGWVFNRAKKVWYLAPGQKWAVDPEQFDKGKPLLNGVDDLIGAKPEQLERLLGYRCEGSRLDELRRLGNQVTEDIQQWIRKHPRKTKGKSHLADARDAMALEALLMHASRPNDIYPFWTYWSSAEMLATVLEYDEPPKPLPKHILYVSKRKPSLPAKYDRVKRAMPSLVDRGLLEKIEGSEEIERKWVRVKGGKRRSVGYGYEQDADGKEMRPRYRIVPPELAPNELGRRSLSELPEPEFYNRVADHLERESTETSNSARIEVNGADLERLASSEAVKTAAARLLLDDSD
jgi:hypothetical protein